MQSRLNFAATALVVLWIVSGLVFLGAAAPPEQPAHANAQAQAEAGKLPSRSAHG